MTTALMQGQVQKLLQPSARLVCTWKDCCNDTVRIVSGDFSVCHCIEIIAMSYKKLDSSISLHSFGCGNNYRRWNDSFQTGIEVRCTDSSVDVDANLNLFLADLPKFVATFFGPKVWSKQDAQRLLAEAEWKGVEFRVFQDYIKKESGRAVTYVACFPRDLVRKSFTWCSNYSPYVNIFLNRFATLSGLKAGDLGKRVQVCTLSPLQVCIMIPQELDNEFCKLFGL